MKIFYESEKSQAMCETCGLVDTTFRYRDVPLSESGKIVPGILVGVCDVCGQLASIPAQSTPAIKAVRELATASIEAVLPAPFVEVLDLICFKIDGNTSTDFRKQVLSYYVHEFASGKLDTAILKPSWKRMEADFPKEKTKNRKRISLKVSNVIASEFVNVAEKLSMSKTDLIKSLVAEIKFDILDSDTSPRMEILKAIAVSA